MLYKVGDRVRVRHDLKTRVTYNMAGSDVCDTATRDMIALAGQVVTIKACGYKYRIAECGWNWTDEMFDGLADDGVAFEFDIEDIF